MFQQNIYNVKGISVIQFTNNIKTFSIHFELGFIKGQFSIKMKYSLNEYSQLTADGLCRSFSSLY